MTEPPTDWIVETTADTFEADVVERSRRTPVVLDFWAEWCQPCRLLGPLLEKLAREHQGRFVLVKADVEALPQQAAEFGVQSIPTVFGLRDAQPVDFFTGLLPEPALRAWLERLLPSAAERLMLEGRALEAADPAAAEAQYRAALAADPKLDAAKISLASALRAQKRLAECGELISELESRGYLEPEAQQLKAALDLQTHGAQAGTVAEARAALTARPDDFALQFRLAEALAAQGEYREALDLALALVERDRHGQGEPARRLMIDIFKLLETAQPELVTDYRRRLSMALY